MKQRAATPWADGSRSHRGGESGHIMVLTIGYVLVALLLITVVSGVASVYIGHKKLLSMADSAALAAADTFELSWDGTAADPSAALSNQGVKTAAQDFLAATQTPSGMSGINLLDSSGARDARTAEVALSAVVHPLFVNFLIPEGVKITVTSTARSKLVM